jgi:hypothetical protein
MEWDDEARYGGFASSILPQDFGKIQEQLFLRFVFSGVN